MNSVLFEKNRKKILDQMIDNSIFIVFNRPKDGDIFKQEYNMNRNYFYITGLLEFENIVVLQKINGNESSVIFINPYDEYKAKWVGAALSKEEVTNISGIKNVRYLDSFESFVGQLMGIVNDVYLDFTPQDTVYLTDDQVFAKKLKDKYPYANIINGRSLFTKARTVKEKEEIDEMKKAISITNEGLKSILSNIKPGLYEYQLEAYFDQAIKYNGATGYAFPTIAAGGKNACCLHYQKNSDVLNDGELVLFDLGCSLNMYCSDISRTYPINGKFTDRQKQLYNIVLNGQKLVFANAKPGITTKELNQILRNYFKEELYKIGLIKAKTEEEVSKYYFHGVSHHIGLDCHDLCEYTALKPGSIISNEPGLYIAEEGIGIRIEDDVLITKNGAEWLSPQIIKEVDDIEKFIKENQK